MKAKLIKSNFDGWTNYYLIDKNNQKVASSNSNDDIEFKLNIDNCEVVEYGFSVELLAKELYESNSSNYNAFINGFNKAMSIKSNYKFTIKDIYNAASRDSKLDVDSYIKLTYPIKDEWVVEVETEEYEVIDTVLIGKRVKLDSSGCLIIKKI